MHRDRWLSVILIVLTALLFTVPLYWGLIKDLSDLLTQIISGGILLLMGAAFSLWVKGGRVQPSSVPKSEVQQNTGIVDQSTPYSVALDPRYEHVRVVVFWSFFRSITHYLGHPKVIKTPADLPRNMYAVNYKTMKAYDVGPHVRNRLFPVRKIDYHSETKWLLYGYQRIWCWWCGFAIVPRSANEPELLEGSGFMPLEPSLLHLTIHYSNLTDNADHRSRPYYVVNHSANLGYWVPDDINAFARQGKVQGACHVNEQEMRDYFHKNGIEVFEHYPFDNQLAFVPHQPSQEIQIPPQFDIANCINCGMRWPVPPLSPLEQALVSANPFYNKDLPRTVTCPKCGVPAVVTAQTKDQENN